MVLLARRRRYCRNCGSVQVAEPEDRCLECGEYALTANGEPWRRIRAKKNEETAR